MAEEEVKQRVTIEGQEALNVLKQLQGEQEKATKGVKDSGDEAEKATRKSSVLTTAWGGMRTQLAGLVTGMLGAGGFLAALRLIRQELEENARATEAFARAQLNLQFLNQTFDAQERDFVGRAAVFAGRDVIETTKAFTDLRSRSSNLSPQQVQALFLEVAESARTTDAPLQSLTNLFSTVNQFIPNAQTAQNVIRQSIIEAGIGDPSKLEPLFAKSLGVLTGTGGLTPSQSAGAVAGATALGLPGDVAVSGLQSVTLGLTGLGTPQGNPLLQRAGIDRTNLLTALRGVSQAVQSGSIQSKELELIAGKEGLAVLQLLTNPEILAGFEGRINSVARAGASTLDLTRAAVQNQFRADPVAATNFALAQAKAEESVLISSDVQALEAQLGRQLLTNELRKRGASPFRRAVAEKQYDWATYFGYAPESAVFSADTMSGGGVLDAGSEQGYISDQLANEIGKVRGGGILRGDGSIKIDIHNDSRIQFLGSDPRTEEIGKSVLP